MHEEIPVLKSLRHCEGDHPEGAMKDRVGRVGPNADHAETDLDRATDGADEIDLRIHSPNSALEWMQPKRLFASTPLRNLDISSIIWTSIQIVATSSI